MQRQKLNPYEAGWNACRQAHRAELTELLKVKRAARLLLQTIRHMGWERAEHIDARLKVLDQVLRGSDDKSAAASIPCGLCHRAVLQQQHH